MSRSRHSHNCTESLLPSDLDYVDELVREPRRACSSFNGDKMRLIVAALTVVLSSPAIAEVTFPVSIPQECYELAQREGVPVLIQNRYQATKAKLKLARLSNRDPLVRECRAAVQRAREAAAHSGQNVSPTDGTD
jgi:hypothetical protein